MISVSFARARHCSVSSMTGHRPAPEVAGRCPVMDETEQCRARAKDTEIMDDTIQHHRSDYNSATTFYQQFPATEHQTAVITLHVKHVHVKTMPRWWRRNGARKHGVYVHVKTMPRYRALLYVNTMPQKRHYTLCICVKTMLWKWNVYTLCIGYLNTE